MPSLSEIEEIGIGEIKRLAKEGIRTTQTLLARGYNRRERKKLAEATGLSEKRIEEWVAKADILQVRGVGPEYAGLLNSVGIDTPGELKDRKPEALAAKMAETNRKKKVVRRLPTLKQITDWILDATAIRGAPHGLAGDADIPAPPPSPPRAKRYKVKY